MNIEPGEGYRLLKRGEKIFPTDEWFADRKGQWEICQDTCSGGTFDPYVFNPHRRKIEPPEQGWMPIGDPAFTKYPCWCWAQTMKVPCIAFNVHQVPFEVTHWHPANPPVPPPVEDQAEKAFLAYYAESWPDDPQRKTIERKAWLAGAQWAKQQKL